MPVFDPKPGQWVHLHAKVIPGPVHPDDVLVELWSHNEQYNVHIRRDAIVSVEQPPWPDEPGDNSIAVVDGHAWQRSGTTSSGAGAWWAAGRVESATWTVLVHDAWKAGHDRPEVVWEP